MSNDFNKLYDHINNNTSDIKEHIRFLLKREVLGWGQSQFGFEGISDSVLRLINNQTETMYEFIKDKIK